jgi:hypothetical protein
MNKPVYDPSKPHGGHKPGAMNYWLDNELCIKRDWDWHPLIIDAEAPVPDMPSPEETALTLEDLARIAARAA